MYFQDNIPNPGAKDSGKSQCQYKAIPIKSVMNEYLDDREMNQENTIREISHPD